MNRFLKHCALAAFLSVVTSACVTSPTAWIAAPYPRSEVIRSARWDLSGVARTRTALGSDLWPLTWGRDGDLYTAWGDGGGFDGTEESQQTGRASLGFARIEGIPDGRNPSSYRGHNLWGTVPYAESQATFGGKVDDIISVDGILYAQGGIWTRENCGCPDPTQQGGDNRVRTVAWSSDLGKSWTLAPWWAMHGLGASLQFGRDYREALDPLHIYLYYQEGGATSLYLRRVKRHSLAVDPSSPGHFEYFSGLGPDGEPTWSATEAKAATVFTDSRAPLGTNIGPAVAYDAALGRFLMVAFHGPLAGQIGIFESASPWGPWATVAYYENWGGFNETAGEGNGVQFPTKWISANGRTLWAVFSGLKTSEVNFFDSFNVAKLTLRTRRGLPRIKAPVAGRSLPAGATVTARGSGSKLTWSAIRVRADGQLAVSERLQSGTGPTFRFTIPADVGPSEFIRVTLTANGIGRVYSDYTITDTR
jgi:hypothetical protein